MSSSSLSSTASSWILMSTALLSLRAGRTKSTLDAGRDCGRDTSVGMTELRMCATSIGASIISTAGDGSEGVAKSVDGRDFIGEGTERKVPVSGEKATTVSGSSASVLTATSSGGVMGRSFSTDSCLIATSSITSSPWLLGGGVEMGSETLMRCISSSRELSWMYCFPLFSAMRQEQHWNWHSIFMKSICSSARSRARLSAASSC